MKKHLLLTTIAAVVLVGCATNQQPTHEIWNAVAANNIEFIKELLISGEDVNAKAGTHGGSPLHATGMFGRKECAEFLIAKGADVNAKDDRGETALDWAIFAYDWEQPEVKAAKKETADLLRKHGGKTGKELRGW